MAGDRSRISYSQSRKYREVVSQQGRVLLEADSNEGQRIFSEEVRHHALDARVRWLTLESTTGQVIAVAAVSVLAACLLFATMG